MRLNLETIEFIKQKSPEDLMFDQFPEFGNLQPSEFWERFNKALQKNKRIYSVEIGNLQEHMKNLISALINSNVEVLKLQSLDQYSVNALLPGLRQPNSKVKSLMFLTFNHVDLSVICDLINSENSLEAVCCLDPMLAGELLVNFPNQLQLVPSINMFNNTWLRIVAAYPQNQNTKSFFTQEPQKPGVKSKAFLPCGIKELEMQIEDLKRQMFLMSNKEKENYIELQKLNVSLEEFKAELNVLKASQQHPQPHAVPPPINQQPSPNFFTLPQNPNDDSKQESQNTQFSDLNILADIVLGAEQQQKDLFKNTK